LCVKVQGYNLITGSAYVGVFGGEEGTETSCSELRDRDECHGGLCKIGPR
jgi:hypothetical protein